MASIKGGEFLEKMRVLLASQQGLPFIQLINMIIFPDNSNLKFFRKNKKKIKNDWM
jgi:hypothetical protein